ncbi:MAG: dihydrofolate reductase [Acidobacteria bacterium]|nr:dihydrofolate reductase [Acidobacteriota bacterium]MBV9478791.1 dihydrofolate reductase [Acidobacteriota bacterium]
MRKLIAYLAISADGFIARADHDVAWLPSPEGDQDYGIRTFYDSIDAVVMGRATWEVGRKLGQEFYPGRKNYVVSRTAESTEHVEVVRDLDALVAKFRSEPGKDIWIVGGAQVFGALADMGELDELQMHIVPTLIGDGIPLLAPRIRQIAMELIDSKSYPDGVVQVRYRLPRRSPAST